MNKNKDYDFTDLKHVTPEVVEQLNELFEFAHPRKLRMHLQTIFFSYLINEHQVLPVDFEEMVTDLQFLFEFLDAVEL